MLFERSPDGIFLIEPEDVPIIVEANRVACEMHGYTREELIGQPISFLDSSDDVALIPERLTVLQTSGSASFEATHVRRDGAAFPVDVLAALLDIGGQRFILSIERDITERKQAELEREAAREHAQVLNQALFQLTAGEISAGLEGILEHVCRHLGLPGGWVIIHKGVGVPYQLAAAYGIPPTVQRAAQDHFPQTCYCIESPATWSDEYAVHVCGYFLALGETRHMLTVPLVLEEQPLGVVDFLAPADLQLPDTARSFLENMAQSVTLALS
ncbi:MAG: PAS domain S-box protein, partial [Anaerolineae bacterium]